MQLYKPCPAAIGSWGKQRFILAPSMRPVQVTKDLKSFWAESYPKLKPALSRRYPRHKWL